MEKMILDSYHSCPRPTVGRWELDTFTFGVEIEKECDTVCRTAKRDGIENPGGMWVIETDSSLGNYGYELVSPAYSADQFIQFEDDIDILRDCIDTPGRKSRRCGGHIHVGVVDADIEQLFDAVYPMLPLLLALFNRRATGTTGPYAAYYGYIDRWDKYNALRITRHNTLEFRIFDEVRSPEQLVRRVNFLRHFVEIAKCGGRINYGFASSEFAGIIGRQYLPETDANWRIKKLELANHWARKMARRAPAHLVDRLAVPGTVTTVTPLP